MNSSTALISLLKRDRVIVVSSLILLSILAWSYLVYLAVDMKSMDMASAMGMQHPKPWGHVEFVLMFVMWFVMMVGMMVPSAAPMTLLFSTVNRKRMELERPYVSTFVFLSGYLFIWAIFSLLATLAQWQLQSIALLSTEMSSTSPILGASILIGAGVYQWTPLKHACLAHCRSPLDFLMSGWKEGRLGAFKMGVSHGYFCLGCCWILMALLFVTGVMNLFWVAMITLFVFIEKVSRAGFWIGRLAGLGLIASGLWMVRDFFV